MSHASFRIIYDGPGLAGGTMDVRDLAPALLAIGDVLEQANRALNGDRAKVTVDVKASFQTGSFGIDLSVAQGLLSQLVDLFNHPQVTAAANLVELLGFAGGMPYALLRFLKWLRGRRITRVQLLDTGTCRVFVDDEQVEVERAVIDLYRNVQLRRALEAAVVKPLNRPGIDRFAVQTAPAEFFEIGAAESGWYAAPPPEDEPIEESDIEANLQLVTVAFREDNKWRFSDGASTFHAAILDDTFLNRVQANEASFAKGDILRVRLHRRQWVSGEDMKTEYTVVQVLDHRHAGGQLRLPFDPGPPAE